MLRERKGRVEEKEKEEDAGEAEEEEEDKEDKDEEKEEKEEKEEEEEERRGRQICWVEDRLTMLRQDQPDLRRGGVLTDGSTYGRTDLYTYVHTYIRTERPYAMR
jgi:hypothetical protein